MTNNLSEVTSAEVSADIKALALRNRLNFADIKPFAENVPELFEAAQELHDATVRIEKSRSVDLADALAHAQEKTVMVALLGMPLAQEIAAQNYEHDRYVFLAPTDQAGDILSVETDADEAWLVSLARPKPGSLRERLHEDVERFSDPEAACQAFFSKMRDEGLPGVFDSSELRAYHDAPEGFVDALTEALHDSMDDIPEEDARVDDMDNMPLSVIREAMVDALEKIQPSSLEP